MIAGSPEQQTRSEVRHLAAWAPIPAEEDEFWQQEVVDRFGADIAAVTPPLSVLERDALLPLLERPNDDTVYGVLWGVLHLIETAPDDGYEFGLDTSDKPWLEMLLTRRRNADR